MMMIMKVRAKLSKILAFWSERGVYDSNTVSGVESSMMSLTDPNIALEQVGGIHTNM